VSLGSARDRITCPHCQGSLKAPPLPAGSLCTCPKCGQSFPIGQPAAVKSAAGRPASTVAAPAPSANPSPASSQPKSKPPAAKMPVEAPVRADLANPGQEVKTPTHPVATAVVTASDDDVIGQMLLGGSAPAPNPQPAEPQPTAPPPAANAPVMPAETHPKQEGQSHDLLSARAGAAGAASSHQAAATTQPAHQQSVSPPQTASAPAIPARVMPPEIPVVCRLCGTRMYARPEQIGTKVRCPDCHSDNEVLAQQPPAAKAAAAPVDAGDDFALSDPGQRPAYRPMVEPRGEYAALKYLDPSAPPRRPDSPAQPRRISTEVTMTLNQAAMDDDDGQEVVLSAPVERIDVKEIVKLPEPDDPDEDNQYRGRFRDEEWGFVADPRQKDAWKKSPFYFGILSFPFYPQTAMRLVLYSFLLTIDLAFFLGAIFFARSESPLLLAALGLVVVSSTLSVFILGGSLPCLVAIAQDTANGNDSVESWPDWNIAEWLFTAMMIPAAAFLAALPGSILSSGLFALGRPGMLLSPYPILVSELMFFPIIFGSMLAEGSFMPMSGAILKSFQRSGEGWLLFYCMSILLAIPLAGSMALVELGVQLRTLLVAPFAAFLWVLSTILYFRLLGRMLWYVHNYRRERDPVD
jgi:DNA-directed RNA polymerase subunit M/transcription elongation factor TFIIS